MSERQGERARHHGAAEVSRQEKKVPSSKLPGSPMASRLPGFRKENARRASWESRSIQLLDTFFTGGATDTLSRALHGNESTDELKELF